MSGWKGVMKSIGSGLKKALASKAVKAIAKEALAKGTQIAVASAAGAIAGGKEGARDAAKQATLQVLTGYTGVPDITDEGQVEDFVRETDNKVKIELLKEELKEDESKAIDRVKELEALGRYDEAEAARDTVIETQIERMQTKTERIKNIIKGVSENATDSEERISKRLITAVKGIQKEVEELRENTTSDIGLEVVEKTSEIAQDLLGEIPEIGSYLKNAAAVASASTALVKYTALNEKMNNERMEFKKNTAAWITGAENDIHSAVIKSLDESKDDRTIIAEEDRLREAAVSALDIVEHQLINLTRKPQNIVGLGIEEKRESSMNGGLFGFLGGFGLHEICVFAYLNFEFEETMYLVFLDTVSVRVKFRTENVRTSGEAVRMLKLRFREFIQNGVGEVDLLHDSVEVSKSNLIPVGRFGDPGGSRVKRNFYSLREYEHVAKFGTSRHARKVICDWLVNGPIVHNRIL